MTSTPAEPSSAVTPGGGISSMPFAPTVLPSDGPLERVMLLHLVGTFCLGTAIATPYILPFLARERFGANNWQTTVLTAAVPVTQFASIFWNRLYARVGTRTYLATIATCACIPIALLAAAQNIWHVMILFVVAACGGTAGVAAMAPLNGDLLQTCYATVRRGRIFGVICAAQFLATMLAGLGMGLWLDHDRDAFRLFFPILAGCMALGLLSYARISSKPFWIARHRAPQLISSSWFSPLRAMREIPKKDRRFAGYEAAFMSYGIGWMICTALIPAIATDKLHLNYTEYSQATVVIYQLTTIVLLMPMGRVADKLGSIKLAAVSFLWLTLYPIALIFVPAEPTFGLSSATWLSAFAMIYAIGMVGVQLTWTLGPVSLAGSSAKAPEYLAIHSTLVGVRGIVAQGLGMMLYALTGSFAWPLALASAGFAWGSWRMRKLAGDHPSHGPKPI